MVSKYEKKAKKTIEKWRYVPHYVIKQCWDIVFLPMPDMFLKYVPFEAIDKVLDMSNMEKQLTLDKQEFLEKNHTSLSELRAKGLEFSDILAEKVCKNVNYPELKEVSADIIMDFLADLPEIMYYSLRFVYKIGLCYGYDIENKEDKNYILAALLSVCGNPFEETPKVEPSSLSNLHIRQIATPISCDITMRKFIVQNPYLNIFLGKSVATWYFKEIGIVAQHIFQKRWLVDHGKWE